MVDSRKYVNRVLILNWLTFIVLGISFFIILGDIRHDIQEYGFKYTVTTTIKGISEIEEVNVQNKYSFSMILLAVTLISCNNVIHFRSKYIELLEEETETDNDKQPHFLRST